MRTNVLLMRCPAGMGIGWFGDRRCGCVKFGGWRGDAGLGWFVLADEGGRLGNGD